MLTKTPMNPLSVNRWTHWDPLKYYPCTVNHAQLLCRTFFYLSSSPTHSSVCILFCLPHFARVTSFKENWATEKWSLSLRRLERIAKRKGLLEILFTRTLTVVNFPCTDWLSGGSCIWEPSNPGNEVENPVECVCGRSLFAKQKIFLTLPSQIIFFA